MKQEIKKKKIGNKYLGLALYMLFLIVVFTVDMVLAYDNGQLPIGNLWDVCMMLFGGFYITVVVMIIVFGIILAIGQISTITIIYFEALFIEAMLLGNGFEFPIIIINAIILYIAAVQLMRLINQADM